MKIGHNSLVGKQVRFGSIDETTFRKLKEDDTLTCIVGEKLTLSQPPTISNEDDTYVSYEIKSKERKWPLYAFFFTEKSDEVQRGRLKPGISDIYSLGK